RPSPRTRGGADATARGARQRGLCRGVRRGDAARADPAPSPRRARQGSRLRAPGDRRRGPGRRMGWARRAGSPGERGVDHPAARAAPRKDRAVTETPVETRLLVATRNEGKMREIRDLFTGLPFRLVFPVDQFLERLPDEADLERGTSFAENAVAKARYFAKRATVPTMAEDSGLEVDALDGAPGVFSARWAQMHGAGRREGGDDAANNALLLERLAGVPDEQRTARYRCVVAYLDTPLAKPQLVEATWEGRILAQARAHGHEGAGPRGACHQGGAERSHDRQPEQTSHCGFRLGRFARKE